MADEKKPSTFNDTNSTIESSKELDIYGVWVKSAPQILAETDDGGRESLIMLRQDNEEALLSDVFQDPLGDTLQSDDNEHFEAPPGVKDIEKSHSIEGEVLDTPSISKAKDIIAPDQEDFTVILNQEVPFPAEEALADIVPPSQSLEQGDILPSPQPLESDISIQLLMKIVDELSLIRDEIAHIKDLLVRPASEEKPVETEALAFLNEGEHEKITLTGNELNNILNTPDFTEGLSVYPIKSEDISIDDLNFLQEDTLAFEPLPFGDKDEGALASLDTSTDNFIQLEGTEEFQRLMQEGDKPILETPKGTEGFESEPPGKDPFDISDMIRGEPNFQEKSQGAFLGEPLREGAVPSEQPSEEALIDNLLIENGSMRDIPIELDPEEEDLESEKPSFGAGEDLEFSNLKEIPGAPIDLSLFLGEEPDISDEELNRIEEYALKEFSMQDNFLQDDFLLGNNSLMDEVKKFDTGDEPEAGEDKKKSKQNAEALASNSAAFDLKEGLKRVLSSLDTLLESLPEDKIKAFAGSEYFDTYKKLFHELGLA